MDKVLNLISLATKAGKVKLGEFLTTKALQEGMGYLVIIATDTSEKSTYRLKGISENYGCQSVVYGTKADLGHFTGKDSKSVICITDEGFADAILKKIDNK
ncbi:MAG: ribosomal L7Ae/L30e/S12e/Gadd45 family protein [Clostridia bacterium]|nr:ribosomal L7Ae/L30e/S12e/Gadd45 family protein [Clostridia bacterium]